MKNKPIEILLIDDEADICDVMSSLLTDADFSVASANDVASAEKIVASEQPPLLICDITMPGKSGLTFLKELREKGIPNAVVMLTAHSESPMVIQALQLGAVDYIVKPFDSKEVVEKMAGWVEIGRRLQAISRTQESTPEKLAKQLRMIELFRLKNHDTSKAS